MFIIFSPGGALFDLARDARTRNWLIFRAKLRPKIVGANHTGSASFNPAGSVWFRMFPARVLNGSIVGGR
jgi:hypothetical protein